MALALALVDDMRREPDIPPRIPAGEPRDDLHVVGEDGENGEDELREGEEEGVGFVEG